MVRPLRAPYLSTTTIDKRSIDGPNDDKTGARARGSGADPGGLRIMAAKLGTEVGNLEYRYSIYV